MIQKFIYMNFRKEKMNEYYRKYHKLANIFPLMQGTEFEALKSDIKENGLIEAIWIDKNGLIIDGRNRHRACLEIGIEPDFKIYSDDDVLNFIISMNIQRRHLNETQRAIIASRIANIEKIDTLKQGSRSANLPIGKISQAEAAEKFNISERMIRTVKSIERSAPELIERMESGHITVNEAAQQLRIIETRTEFEEKAKTKKSLPANIKLLEGDIFKRITEIDDKSIDLLVTDPPYQVMKDYEWDKQDEDFTDNWLKAIKPKLKNEHIGFIFYDAKKSYEFKTVLVKYFKFKNILCWIHRNISMGRVVKDNFISTVEVIFYFGTKDLNLPLIWGEERFNSFEYAAPQSNFKEGKFHPTQKPLKLFKRLIHVGSKEGELVADIFAGSGTAGIACKELNRSCILIEKEQEYINVIKGRL